MTLKLSQNQKLELKKTMKLDIVQIYVQTPKTVLIPYPDPKNSPLGIKKPNTTPKLSKNQKSELKDLQKLKVVQPHEQTQNQF